MTTLEDICICEFGPMLGDGRTDSNKCPVHDMTHAELVEYAALGWREVWALEERLEAAEDALTDLRSLHYQMQTVIREHGEYCAAIAEEEKT